MWPAAPPTSAPLMQPLASAVTVCAVSRSAAVTAANKNFMRSSLLGRLLNETRQREVPTSPTIPFYVIGSSQSEIGHKVGDRQPDCAGAHGRVQHNRTTAGQLSGTAACGLRRLSTCDFVGSAWL